MAAMKAKTRAVPTSVSTVTSGTSGCGPKRVLSSGWPSLVRLRRLARLRRPPASAGPPCSLMALSTDPSPGPPRPYPSGRKSQSSAPPDVALRPDAAPRPCLPDASRMLRRCLMSAFRFSSRVPARSIFGMIAFPFPPNKPKHDDRLRPMSTSVRSRTWMRNASSALVDRPNRRPMLCGTLPWSHSSGICAAKRGGFW